MDDHVLLRAYLDDGSQAAFTQLVERYLPLVHNAALRRMNGDEPRAREVTQLVFSELVQKAAKLVRHPALAAWLHQSTRWHAANLRRAERRRWRHEAAAAEHLARTSPSENELSWESLRPVLDAALDSLRPAERDAVLQRYFMDQPFAAIGRQFGTTENAARMRVDRALETLRQALIRYGVTSSGAALALVLVQHARAAVPSELTASTVASTACQAAAAGTAAATGTSFFMTKSAVGVVGACTVALSAMLWHQEETNSELARELAALQTSVHERARPSSPPAEPTAAALSPEVVKELEDDILAAAEFVVPLTAEQQERVRLDTIVRKGELDFEYAMLFRQLRLPPATLDALKTLLVERNQAIYDARQLAKEEGLVFASVAEEKAVTNSAVSDVDARISALLGGDAYAKLREHVDLEFYRRIAEVARRDETSRANPADDERVRELARRLQHVAPDYEEEMARQNGWPVEQPPLVRETIAAFVGSETPRSERWFASPESLALNRRMWEIARDALLDGRIPMEHLSGAVARDYQAARERLKNGFTP